MDYLGVVMIKKNPVWVCELVYDGKLVRLNNYSICKDGTVTRIKRGNGTQEGRTSKICKNKDGYYFVQMRSDDGIKIRPPIHRLIAHKYLGPCPAGLVINHKNGNKLDNDPNNYEYVTPSENSEHAYRIGLTNSTGVNNTSSKLTDIEVRKINKLLEKGCSCREL